MFNWSGVKKPIIGLSPMAGYTDSPFRRICKEIGADILYSELISATALFYNPKDEKTLKLCSFEETERPFILQLFGKEPSHFMAAIKALENAGIRPDGIDINMGCPANKVIKSGYGSSLIREVDQAIKIIKRIKKEYKDLPLSVKTRSGWDTVTVPDFAKELEKVGADAIAVHARTYKQGFAGKADWNVIKEVKEAVKIPVLGNGDIKTKKDILKMIKETGCDGVLIGRGALGNPWILEKNNNYTSSPSKSIGVNLARCEDSSLYARTIKILLKHIDYAEKFYGKERAVKEMRKHYGFYLKGLENISELRKKIVLESDLDEVKETLKQNYS